MRGDYLVAVQQMNRNIELIRYRRFGDDLLLLELVNAVNAASDGVARITNNRSESGQPGTFKTASETAEELQVPLGDLYEELKAFMIGLGDDSNRSSITSRSNV